MYKTSHPDFIALLQRPLLAVPLPSDFKPAAEATHLFELWSNCSDMRNYRFVSFVHAGGSGMVFKVQPKGSNIFQALKIARSKLFRIDSSNVATALSPVSQRELLALETISHPNVVRLYGSIEHQRGIIGIGTTYVENPKSLDLYLIDTLAKHPDPTGKKGINPFSPQRLDDACEFLVSRCISIASALAHMHNLNIYHLDVKPANILISSSQEAMLTDLGSCIHLNIHSARSLRVNFTWTYAHPDLTTVVNDPGSISGGGLKASASVKSQSNLAKFDLFAFGRTIQEALAILESEFGERCHTSYGFRFLHLIACLLLDGHNAPSPRNAPISERHGRRFASDTALGYPVDLFDIHKIR